MEAGRPMVTVTRQAGAMALIAYAKNAKGEPAIALAKPVSTAATPAPNSPEAKKAAEAAEALAKLKKEMRLGKKNAIGDAKGRAKAKLQQVMERLKLLKKIYANDPKAMAKALAAAAKELKAAVKDYGKAAKEAGELYAQDFASLPDAATDPEGAAAQRKQLEDEAKMEAAGDMDFLKEVRSTSQALKDELQTAKTKGILTQPGKFERSDEVKEAEDGLKELDEMTEDLDQQVRRDMPPGSLITLAA
ncbi:hypothetical protein OVA11_18140 [Caulobacter sp. SL161]|uniref:hypothetical protein n=1 Tax=Caulobacter sp. SL161 TaxID=2995156 RepID=UPI0022749083|nr:hypothetical protein [Caulobacter sp. SL161]MCY1648902.1 hypothetical protein [Caulobacter sp. SL161]